MKRDLILSETPCSSNLFMHHCNALQHDMNRVGKNAEQVKTDIFFKLADILID